jgi:hypothetical protein
MECLQKKTLYGRALMETYAAKDITPYSDPKNGK